MGWRSVHASQVLPHRSRQTLSVWTSLCKQGHCHAETRKGSPQTAAKVRNTESSLYAVELRFPVTGNINTTAYNDDSVFLTLWQQFGEGPFPWKTSPDHYSSTTKLYSWHYALAQVAFTWHPPNPYSSVGLPDGEAWFLTPENTFPLLQALHQSSRRLAVRLLGHRNPFHEAADKPFLCWRHMVLLHTLNINN